MSHTLDATTSSGADMTLAPRIICPLCQQKNVVKSFASMGSYKFHKKTLHPETHVARIHKPEHTCNEPNCKAAYFKVDGLLQHLREVHKMPQFHTSTRTFPSVDEFTTWRRDTEARTLSKYSLDGGVKATGEGQRLYKLLRCSRTQKSRKVKGRVAFKCTAFIRVVENGKTQGCEIEYCLEHHGHEPSSLTDAQFNERLEDVKKFYVHVTTDRSREKEAQLSRVAAFIAGLNIPSWTAEGGTIGSHISKRQKMRLEREKK